MNIRFISTCFVVCSIGYSSAQADDFVVKLKDSHYSFGILNLYAEEIVWDNTLGGAPANEKLSQLNWSTYWAPSISAGIVLGFGDHFDLNADATFSLSGDSYMVDYDWLVFSSTEPDSWSERSRHEDTRLDYFYSFDVSASKTYAVYDKQLLITPMIGANYTRTKWTAYGGDYVYSYDDFRDEVGTFPDGEKGISYRMSYFSPYIGARLAHDYGNFQLETYGKIGFSLANVADQHFMAGLDFEGHYDPNIYTSAGVKLTYQVVDNLSGYVGFDWQGFPQNTGDTDVYDLIYDESSSFPDGEATSLRAYKIDFGMSYSF